MRLRRWRKRVKGGAIFVLVCLASLWIVALSAHATDPLTRIVQSIPESSSAPQQLEREGWTFYDAGQFSQAATTWQEAQIGFANLGDPLSQAGSLNYLSMALWELGRLDDAKAAVEDAIRLSNDFLRESPGNTGSQAILAQALNNRGRIELALGNAQTALLTWRAAAETYKSLEDEVGRLGAMVNQAIALQNLGLYRRSEATLEEANQQLAAIPDSRLKATALRNLGIALQVAGDLHRSQIVLEESLAIAQTLNSPSEIGATLMALGNSARNLQNFEEALLFYQQAAQMAVDLPNAAIAAGLNELNLLVELQRWDIAQRKAQTLQAAILQLSPSRAQVYAAVNWADNTLRIRSHSSQSGESPNPSVTLATSEVRDIAEILSLAVQTARKIDDPKAEAYALGQLGTLYADRGQWSEALTLTRKALLITDRLNASEVAWKWQVQLGQLLQKQGDDQKAIVAYTEAVRTLSGLRQDLAVMNPDIQFSFRNQVEPVYRELVGLLLQSPTQPHLVKARETMEALQLAELDNFFREACLTAKPVRVDSIDPKAATIYPMILRNPTSQQVRLETIVSLPGQQLHHYQTLIPQAEFDNAIDRFRQSLSLSFPQSDRLALYGTIYDWLMRPLEPELNKYEIETLVFVLDESLRNLPMSVLYDGDRYLIEKYAVALTPSLQLLEPRQQDDRRLQAFVGGISQSRQGFPALPEVQSEIIQIGQEITTRVKLDDDFTTEAVKAALAENPSSILHFATHGQFSSNADETFILTWDGRINVSELENWLGSRDETQSQAIDLLVLSACQTARGDTRAVLGLAGFAVKSGARSTLATLWSVRDESTALLMAQFYRQIALPNMTKAEALRQAQLTLLHESQYIHPFYWAAFVLVGNWL
ncbi:MAG: CHAT domain-containing protein [Geitlerinemataceae cyanobacterium]